VRPITILKIGASAAVGLVLLYGVGALIAYLSLREPAFDPPEVAALGAKAPFEAYRVLEGGSGYVVAGVVGSSDPVHARGCSGRFALMFLDPRGRATRAALLPGIEESHYCAGRVDGFLPAPGGGWLVVGTGVRDGGPDPLFSGRSTDSLPVTFRVDASGSLVGSFGDHGRVEKHRAAGRVEGAVFTTRLERMNERGDVRDGFLVSDAKYWGWPGFEVEDELLVAIDYGSGLRFHAFERDAPGVAAYRPLHSLPAFQSEPTVDLEPELGIGDTLLLDGVLYVAVNDEAGARINAVDPRRLELDFGFNGTGALRLPGHVTSTRLVPDGLGGFVVAMTTIDRGRPGDRLHVLRQGAREMLDTTFGGRVKRGARDVLLDPGLDDAVLDSAGRTVVLGGGSTVVRLDQSGKLDGTFGDGGVSRLRAVRVCDLAPAARADACLHA
jgi:hypothetical protein